MLDSTHKENIKKTRETITSIVGTKKLCVCQNIPFRGNRDNTKNHPEVGKVVLLFQENLYYSIELREGRKTFKTSFRMPHDIFYCFSLDFFIF